MTTLSVCIPSIPPRGRMLMRALASVAAQTRQPDQIVVSIDNGGIGSAANRNKALEAATGDWVAFLDDDDEFLPRHLERLLQAAEDNPFSDLIYPWFEGINTEGIFTVPQRGEQVPPFGVAFDAELDNCIRNDGNFIPVTVLVRTDLIRKVGGFVPLGAEGADQCDDWGCWKRLLEAGASFSHLPERTWRWNGHPHHTSGRKWTEVYP